MKRLPDDPRRHFADRVARLQLGGGLSNQALAERAKLSPDELDEILRAESPLSLDAIFLLAGALGVEPGDLLDGIEWLPDGRGGGEYRADCPDGN